MERSFHFSLKASTCHVMALCTLQALPWNVFPVGCCGEKESALSRLTGWCQILFNSEPVNKLNSTLYQPQRVTRNCCDTSITWVLSWDPAPCRFLPVHENWNSESLSLHGDCSTQPKKEKSISLMTCFPLFLIFFFNKLSTNLYALDLEQHFQYIWSKQRLNAVAEESSWSLINRQRKQGFTGLEADCSSMNTWHSFLPALGIYPVCPCLCLEVALFQAQRGRQCLQPGV